MNGQCDGFSFGPGGVCTQQAVASVVVKVLDDKGQTVPFAVYRYRANGGQVVEGYCETTCGSLVLAFELLGRFDVEVTAPGFATADKSVTVVLDDAGCHPKTQVLTFLLVRDETVAALAGVWYTQNFFGDMVLRFGLDGKVIGAIFYDRTIGGDGNFYVSYNGRSIRGAPGQPLHSETAPDPTRTGNTFDFEVVTLGIPTGFTNATLSPDFLTLTGTLSGQPITYTRLSESEIPDPIRDPL